MEITNLTHINFVNNFAAFDDLTGLDFILDLNENHDKILQAVTAFSKVIEPSKAYKEFQQKGTELYKKYAEKDDKGDPKTKTIGQGEQARTDYVLEEANKGAFRKEYEALTKEYEKAIQALEDNRKEYQEKLYEKAKEVKLKKFTREDIPKNINSKQLKLLYSVGMMK